MSDTKETKIKRTHTFDRMTLKRVEKLAAEQRRPISQQIAILLEDALSRAEKKQAA